jgi:hypothetical protein
VHRPPSDRPRIQSRSRVRPRHLRAVGTRAVGAVAGLGIAALLLAGCGSSEPVAGPDGAAPTTVAAPATTAPAKPLTATTASWKLDKAWSRAVVLDDGGQLLAFSGLDAGKHSLSRVVRVDPATGKLTEAPKLPRLLHDAAGTMLGGNAILIGGGEQESGYANVTAVTGPKAGSDLGKLPEARSDLAAITVGDTAYVVGGYDGTNFPPAILATTDGVAFKAVGRLDPPVRYPALATAGGQVFVFGGKTAAGQTDAIQRLDPANGAVSTVGRFPAPLGHAVAFTLDGHIYVAGGRVGTSTSDSGNKVSNQIWSFDPATGAVTPAGTLPYAVADAGAAVVGDRAYILGGETDGADTATNKVIVLTV